MKPCLVYLANVRSVFTIRWANYFASRGWNVHIVTWRAPRSVSPLLENIRIWRILSPPHYVFRWSALAEIAIRLRRLHPDIVHGHYLHTFGVLAGFSTYIHGGCPVIVSGWGPHGLLHCRQPLRRLIRIATTHADAVTASTAYLADILRREYGVADEKLHCFPWGVDTTVFSCRCGPAPEQPDNALQTPAGLPVIFSPRTAARHYRIEMVVRAVAQLHRSGQTVRLVVAAGPGADRAYLARLQQLVGQSRLQDAVVIIEHELTADQMADLYRSAVATVSIPVDDQFGASVLEAMACGSVPIVSRLPAYRQYLTDGENALFVNGDDPGELAKAIARAMSDTALQQRCTTVNPALIRKYEDWNRNAAQMERLYLSLIAARKGSGPVGPPGL